MKTIAVVMRRTGPPKVLGLEELDLEPLRAGEVRLRTLASAVNHSDLEIRCGDWLIQLEPKKATRPAQNRDSRTEFVQGLAKASDLSRRR